MDPIGEIGGDDGQREETVDPLALAETLFDRQGPATTLWVQRLRPIDARGYCGAIYVDGASAPELTERIRAQWGGGDYLIRVCRDGRFVRGASGMVVIAGPPARMPSAAIPSPSPMTSPSPSVPVVVQAPQQPSTIHDVLATARALTEIAQRSPAMSSDPELVRELATLRAQLSASTPQASPHHEPEIGGLLRQVRALRTLAAELGMSEAGRAPNPSDDDASVGGVKLPRDPMEMATMFGMFWMMREMSKPQVVPVPQPDGSVRYQVAPADPAQAQMMAGMLGMPMGMGMPQQGMPMGMPMGMPQPQPQPQPQPTRQANPAPTQAADTDTAEPVDDDGADDELLTPEDIAEEIAAVPEGEQMEFLGRILRRLPPSLLQRMMSGPGPGPDGSASQPSRPPLSVAVGGAHE